MYHSYLTDSYIRAGRLREIRKLIGRVIGTRGSLVKFYPSQDYQATMFLKRVLDNPAKLDEVRIFCHDECPMTFPDIVSISGYTQVSTA